MNSGGGEKEGGKGVRKSELETIFSSLAPARGKYLHHSLHQYHSHLVSGHSIDCIDRADGVVFRSNRIGTAKE